MQVHALSACRLQHGARHATHPKQIGCRVQRQYTMSFKGSFVILLSHCNFVLDLLSVAAGHIAFARSDGSKVHTVACLAKLYYILY